MYRMEDTLAGRRIDVVYDAPQLPLPREMGRWERGTQVRRWLASNGAKRVLRTRDGDGEIWWAAPGRGVSLAAALDAWLEGGGAAVGLNAAVVIPLDRRTYLAEVTEGLVAREWALVAEKAAERLQEWADGGVPVHAFDAGGRASVGEYAELEPVPFDLREYAYRGRLRSFAANGLFHPAFAAAVALAAAAAFGAMEYRGSAARETAALAKQLSARSVALRELSADYSGAARLGAAAQALFGLDAGLRRDGLRTAEYRGGDGVATYLGGIPDAYPSAAAAVARREGWEFTLGDDGWQVRRWTGAHETLDSIEGVSHEAAAEAVYEAGHRAGGRVQAEGAVTTGAAMESHYTVEFVRPTAHGFAVFASGLADLPVAVHGIECSASGWTWADCKASVSVKGAR